MEEGRYTDGKPESFRGGRGKRVYGRRDGGGRGVRDGGFRRGGGRGEKRAKFEMDVCPQHLRFTQDSIGNKFKPPFEYLHIDVAVQQIRLNLLSPSQMTQLNVVRHKGILWSLDNRRLWVFRKAQVEEITVNLVPINFSPRSSEFFSTLNADLEEIYSNPLYYPRIRGRLGNTSSLGHFNDVKITCAETTLPSLPTRSSQQNAVIPKSTASDLISIAAKKDSSSDVIRNGKDAARPLAAKLGNVPRPGRIPSPQTSGASKSSSFPKLSPEQKVMPILNVVRNPKPTLNEHQRQHQHVIDISNQDPNEPLLSSEKEGVSENLVIRIMKKLFHALRFCMMKVCWF